MISFSRPIFLSIVLSTLGAVLPQAQAAANFFLGQTNPSESANFSSGTNDFNAIEVGNIYASNSLLISSGAVVTNSSVYLGNGANSSNNSLLVTDPNSTLSGGILYVGYAGPSNSLVISNAGTVINSQGYIGYTNTASNNSVLVTGTNSLWKSGPLYFGYNSDGNSLVISNGGTVSNSSLGYIGSNSTSSNNSVLVTGTNSLWKSSSTLYIGRGSAGNSLVISNGGTVSNGVGIIGSLLTATNNSVLVTGANSTWSNTLLTIGSSGSGTLTIASGGKVTSPSLSIASSSGSRGTLNLGSLGGSDTAGMIQSPTIGFGSGTGIINFNQIDRAILTSSITGTGTINQLGSGTTILAASNSWNGNTLVSNGTLLITGASGTGTITVGTNGTLGGSGTITSETIINGALSPSAGTNPALLTFSTNLTLGSTATTTLQIAATNSYDQLSSGGTLTYAGALVMNLGSLLDFPAGTFTLFTPTSYVGDFTSIIATNSAAQSWIFGDNGGIWTTTTPTESMSLSLLNGELTVLSVPEPSTYALLILGGFALLAAYKGSLRSRDS